MNDAELAGLEHDNMITAMSTVVAGVQGARVARADGVVALLSGLPLLPFNQILIDDATATDQAVSEAVASARARGHSFVVSLRVGADDRFVELMASLSLVPKSVMPWMPGMALFPITPSAAPQADHTIVQVTDEHGLEDHIRAAVTGFDMPESWERSVVGPALLDRPGISLYTGYVNDEPVSTGLGFRTGRTIGVYSISTVPEARKHGYGEQMTRRVADDGVQAGCDVAVLQASDMGLPIYERMGYRTVVEYMAYVEPLGASHG